MQSTTRGGGIGALPVRISLDRLRCVDKGRDGSLRAEPYAWVLFFKFDGLTVSLADGTLSGAVTTRTHVGSHDSLGGVRMRADDVIDIPAGTGRWETDLVQIPLLDGPGDVDGGTTPGTTSLVSPAVGVVVALMEFDLTSENAAEAGHRAFNRAIEEALNRALVTVDSSGIDLANPALSEEERDVIAEQVRTEVVDAIVARGNLFGDIANLINADDFIGAGAAVFTAPQLLLGDRDIQFALEGPEGEGFWEITGRARLAGDLRRATSPQPRAAGRPSPRRPRGAVR